MNKIVNKNTRRDKKAFADQLAREAEEATNKRDMSALHKITRRLCQARQKCSTVVKDREKKNYRFLLNVSIDLCIMIVAQ